MLTINHKTSIYINMKKGIYKFLLDHFTLSELSSVDSGYFGDTSGTKAGLSGLYGGDGGLKLCGLCGLYVGVDGLIPICSST